MYLKKIKTELGESFYLTSRSSSHVANLRAKDSGGNHASVQLSKSEAESLVEIIQDWIAQSDATAGSEPSASSLPPVLVGVTNEDGIMEFTKKVGGVRIEINYDPTVSPPNLPSVVVFEKGTIEYRRLIEHFKEYLNGNTYGYWEVNDLIGDLFIIDGYKSYVTLGIQRKLNDGEILDESIKVFPRDIHKIVALMEG